MAARFVREAIVENASFLRSLGVALNDKRRGSLAQIVFGLLPIANQLDADTSLADIGFEHEWQREIESCANFVERAQSLDQCVANDQVCFRSELRAGLKQVPESSHLGFAYHAAGEDAGICGGRHC